MTLQWTCHRRRCASKGANHVFCAAPERYVRVSVSGFGDTINRTRLYARIRSIVPHSSAQSSTSEWRCSRGRLKAGLRWPQAELAPSSRRRFGIRSGIAFPIRTALGRRCLLSHRKPPLSLEPCLRPRQQRPAAFLSEGFLVIAADRVCRGFSDCRNHFVPDCQVTDHQMSLFMKFRQTHTTAVAAAKASISKARHIASRRLRGALAEEGSATAPPRSARRPF